MENAVDALKMAAAILIFIIALATSFSVFGTAKGTADSIITMRDKQAYLEAAQLDNGILYTSSGALKGETGLTGEQVADTFGVTSNGDRIVSSGDVFSTIYRYAIENYSVSIIDEEGFVITRYDTSIENYIAGGEKREFFKDYQEKIRRNISTEYCINPSFVNSTDEIENLYEYKCPWLGQEKEIKKRINADITGKAVDINGTNYQGIRKGSQKGLKEILAGKRIVEVTNEIDTSKYLKDEGIETNLLQQYNIPTVEIVYIILNS